MAPQPEVGSHSCRKCNHSYNTEEEFNQHKVASSRHTCCRVCFKDFVTKEACDGHEKQFHGAKQNLPCPCCRKIFTTLGGLISHFEHQLCEAVPDFKARQKQKKEFYDNHNNIRNFVEFGRTAGDFIEEEPMPKLIRVGEASNERAKNLLDDDDDNLSFGEPEVDNWPTRQQDDDAGDLIDFSTEYVDTVAYVEGDDLLTFDAPESVISDPWNKNIAKIQTVTIAPAPARPCTTQEMIMPHLSNATTTSATARATVRPVFDQEMVHPHLRKSQVSGAKHLSVFGASPANDNIPGARKKPSPTAPAFAPAKAVSPSPSKPATTLNPAASVWGAVPTPIMSPIVPTASSSVWGAKPKTFASIAAINSPPTGAIKPLYESFVPQQQSTSQATTIINPWGVKDTINPQAGEMAAQLAAGLRAGPKAVSGNTFSGISKENSAWPKLGVSPAKLDENNPWFADLPSPKSTPVSKPQETTGWGVDGWGTDPIEPLTQQVASVNLNQSQPPARNDKVDEDPYNPDTPGFNAEKYYVPALRKYKCPHKGCKKSNDNKSAFFQHLKSVAHAKDNLQCRKCLRIFGTATALTQHSASQGVRCDVRNTEAYSAVVDEFTAGTAAPVGRHADETIRYAVNDITASALTSGNIVAHHKAAAEEANDNFNNYWSRRRPAW